MTSSGRWPDATCRRPHSARSTAVDGSVRAFAGEHGGDRAQDDRDVQPERPVLEVGEVEPDEVVEAEARATGDLPQPGDARQHVVALAVPRLEQLEVA